MGLTVRERNLATINPAILSGEAVPERRPVTVPAGRWRSEYGTRFTSYVGKHSSLSEKVLPSLPLNFSGRRRFSVGLLPPLRRRIDALPLHRSPPHCSQFAPLVKDDWGRLMSQARGAGVFVEGAAGATAY